MTKLTRKTQKIFAGNADSDQITAFGTAKSTPVYTSDPDTIQTDAYTQGWTPSLMSDLAPYLQDSNALNYVMTRQLAYLYQEGIPEWDANTEYSIGSMCKIVSNSNTVLYTSKTNGNKGNAVTNTTYWNSYSLSNIATALSTANTALSTANSKTTTTQASNMSMPNYASRGTVKTNTNYTASYNGWLFIQTGKSDDKDDFSVVITMNNVSYTFRNCGNTTASEHFYFNFMIPIPKGAVFKINPGEYSLTCYWIKTIGG